MALKRKIPRKIPRKTKPETRRGAEPEGKRPDPPGERRSYRQYCGLAKALDALGERWTLLIARDLMLGPRRYGDLLKGLEGLTTNLLAERLKDMEAMGLIAKTELAPPLRGSAYALTQAGRELEPVLLALGKWGWRFMEMPGPEDRRNLAWGLFALKRRYRGVTQPLTAELRAGERIFQFRLSPDYADLREGPVWLPDVHVQGAPDAFMDLFYLGRPQGALTAEGRLAVSGSEAGLRSFLEAFGLAA
jgi:DNA-binding HxlR family transcriptional regulator